MEDNVDMPLDELDFNSDDKKEKEENEVVDVVDIGGELDFSFAPNSSALMGGGKTSKHEVIEENFDYNHFPPTSNTIEDNVDLPLEELNFEGIQGILSSSKNRDNGEEKLRDETKYSNMHAKNIHIFKRAVDIIKDSYSKVNKKRLALVTGAVLLGSIVFFNRPTIDEDSISVTSEDDTYDENAIYDGVIDPAQCDLSKYLVVLNNANKNANELVQTSVKELNYLGIANEVVDLDTLSSFNAIKEKCEKDQKEIIIINYDGAINGTRSDVVVMTNYENDVKSADNLALAIGNASRDIYGLDTEIKCGKAVPLTGGRGMTSVEENLRNSDLSNDVICLTIAPNNNCLGSEISSNSLATSVVEGVVRLASLSEDKRYEDSIRRVESGDILGQLAIDNGVTESSIIANNTDVIDSSNQRIIPDTALIIRDVDSKLTGDYSVKNGAITTNPDEVEQEVAYYAVKKNDTASEIAESLGVKLDELIVPSGDVDKIYPGDKIGYVKNGGPILVSKSNEKNY